MKRNLLKAGFIAALAITNLGFAQEYQLDNFNPSDKRSINAFEPKKDSVTNFDHLRVKIGGAFALQFQGLSHKNTAVPVITPSTGVNANELFKISNNFNLPTANLDIDVALYDGVNLHLRTFLSSRHHNETYVKGGYLQIDKLDFIKKDFLKDVMKYATIKIGQDEMNYGDAHFRRTDNAYSITNPFIAGNILMDAYATFPFMEVYYRRDGFIGMMGASNGRLNQTATSGTAPSLYAKLGYDKQINPDLRVRLTGSIYNNANSSRLDFYNGDRAGSRYYFVLESEKVASTGAANTGAATLNSAKVVPDFVNKMTAIMINPFVRYKGLEFFGTYETVSGRNLTEQDRRTYNQYSAELLYRFGTEDSFYFGGRYNQADGKLITGEDITVKRYNIGGGWFMTKNILAKAEYVNQKHDGYPAKSIFNGGEFKGYVIEAVISF